MPERMSYNPQQESKKPARNEKPQELKRVIAEELQNADSERVGHLNKFKEKIDGDLGENGESEITPARAHDIFENTVISTVNDELAQEIGEKSSLKWIVDAETPAGRFAVIDRLGTKPLTEAEAMAKKLPEDLAKVYDLKTEQVKEIFNQLEPAVKESFLNGLREQIQENINYTKKLVAKLKMETDPNKKAQIRKQIADEETAREEISMELEALS